MDEINYKITIIILVILLSILLLMTTIGLFNVIGEAKELGQSICEEEYNADYVSYYDHTLKCKDKQAKEHYDGLVVEVI